jgi:hydrogenase maturation factor
MRGKKIKEKEGSDPYDEGYFEQDLVFIAMSFSVEEMEEVWNAIKDECERLELNVVRVDERVGSGFIVREITELVINRI